MLADMPFIDVDVLERLIVAFRATKQAAVVRASYEGRGGNPVLIPNSLFGEIGKLSRDVGARHVLAACGLAVIDVEIGEGAHLDIDTPEGVVAQGGNLIR